MDKIVPYSFGNRVLILPKVARAPWMNFCCLCTRKQSVWVRIWRCNRVGHVIFTWRTSQSFHWYCAITVLEGAHRKHRSTLMFRHVNSDYSCEWQTQVSFDQLCEWDCHSLDMDIRHIKLLARDQLLLYYCLVEIMIQRSGTLGTRSGNTHMALEEAALEST